MPEVLHVATLVDKNGVKIGSQPAPLLTGLIDPAYEIMPLIEKGANPIDVLEALHHAAGGEPFGPWPEDKVAPFGYFWQNKTELTNCWSYIRPNIPITIPKDWFNG